MDADQRFAAKRPDVLVYQTAPLDEDITFLGRLRRTCGFPPRAPIPTTS